MNQICDTGIGIAKRNKEFILHLSFFAPACLRFACQVVFSFRNQAKSQIIDATVNCSNRFLWSSSQLKFESVST